MKCKKWRKYFGYTCLTLIVAFIFLFFESRYVQSPSSQADLYGAGTPYEILSKDCNAGQAVDGSVPIEWYCHRLLQDSISERVETSTGMLLVRQKQTLWLNDKKLTSAKWIVLVQGLPEKDGLPSIFIVNISPIAYSDALEDADIGNRFNHLYLHIVDVGVQPPFMSERLPMAGVRDENGDRGILNIQKIDNDTFMISGESLPENSKESGIKKLSIRYSRKEKAVSLVQP